MTAFRLFPAIIAICSASSAFGTTPKCDIDLAKLQESRSDATTIKVAVQRTACASIGDGGSLTVSDTQALVADVIEWKELGGGAREPGVVRLTRHKAGTYTVQLQRRGSTTVFVITG